MLTQKLTNAVAIIILCTVAATAYGIIHDQVTVRICLEYFTVFHPPIFGRQQETMLAILWGFNATWWVGALLGIILAGAACIGKAPIRHARSFIVPLLKLLLVMSASAAIAGATGYLLTETHTVPLDAIYTNRLQPSMYSRFAADAYAHNTSYLAGIFGGCVIIVNTWKLRKAKLHASN